MILNNITGKPFCVAGMMDDILYECLKYECYLQKLDFMSWRYCIGKNNPDIILFSYCEISKYFRLTNNSENFNIQIEMFYEILDYCNIKNIKTVLWINSEDKEIKLFFSLLDRKFDAVFSICKSHVEKRIILSKNNTIFYLPFAAQPSLFNPIDRNTERIGIVSSPEECLRMSCCYPLTSCYYKKFDILSIQKFSDKEHNFVPNYIFDILACGKILVCPNHKYIKELFYNGINFANDEREYDSLCFKYSTNKNLCDKLSIVNIRHILSAHTYTHRFIQILSELNLCFVGNSRVDGATVLCRADNYAHIFTALNNFVSQNIENKHLFLFINNKFIYKSEVEKIVSHLHNVNICFFDDARNSYYMCVEKAIMNSPFNIVAFFNPEDYYLPYYLIDASNCIKFWRCKITGKKTILTYNKDDGSIQLEDPGQEDKFSHSVAKWSCAANKDVFYKVNIDMFLENNNKFWDMCNLYGFKVYSSNRFNYMHKCSS